MSRLVGHTLIVFTAVLLPAVPAPALEPAQVFVVANRNVPASRDVADHYLSRRHVPRENLILLDLPTAEDISRADYDAKLVAPLRAALADRRDRVKVLLTVYGVPLRVGPAEPTAQEKAELERFRPTVEERDREVQALRKQVADLEAEAKKEPAGDAARRLPGVRQELNAAAVRLEQARVRAGRLGKAESGAAVDSELMLLWWDGYELSRWVWNPLNWQAPPDLHKGKPPVLMTCRLDGPTPEIAKGLVDQAVEVERKGLTGRVYIDARGIRFDPAKENGYGLAGYDQSFRETAELLTRAGLPVTLDDRPEVFPPNSCPDCALYTGWYSLATYVDSFRFVPGAVAWHLASSECGSLHRTDGNNQWCYRLLQNGVAATLGPVGEPYTVGFPKPEEFFGFLATGQYTLVECYSRTALMASWMGVLIGDPLYNPFAKSPKLRPDQVHPSPRGAKFILELREP
jgi:uncharacterized protein (TIGR03790 family)